MKTRGSSGAQEPVIVDYRETGSHHEGFQNLRMTNLPFDLVVERLRAAIVAEGIIILAEIDSQAVLAEANYKIGPARQILFYHPRLMARLLAIDTAAYLEAPLKFAIIEGDRQVSVRWHYPAPAYASYSSDLLADLGEELSQVCKLIAAKALQDS
jgi:uncharacterized protein (DUF302 family)